MKKIFYILLISCVFLSGCDDTEYYYNDGYETGYDDGYEIGWNGGYEVGYENGWGVCIDDAFYNEWFYERINDSGILTSKEIIENALFEENYELVMQLENYYEKDRLYGSYVGDSSTNLLHLTNGECFENIDVKNLVLFHIPLKITLEKGIYSKCHCLDGFSDNEF